jgi:hypothetical protein
VGHLDLDLAAIAVVNAATSGLRIVLSVTRNAVKRCSA